MFQDDPDFIEMVKYMKAHWPSKVKDEWQVGTDEYPRIMRRAIKDLIAAGDKSQRRSLVRIAGLSGSGKTTQLLPAAEAYFKRRRLKPALVAAREFVKYHPHYEEILEFYGEENLRKMTDEFATIMMFMVLTVLMINHYDIILDVTLLDPKIEAILTRMVDEEGYIMTLMMIAASPEVTEKFLRGRKWRHSKETEQEFIRATREALKFYIKNQWGMQTIIWNTYDKEPVYDGATLDKIIGIFDKYSSETEIPEHDEDELREAKIKYLTSVG